VPVAIIATATGTEAETVEDYQDKQDLCATTMIFVMWAKAAPKTMAVAVPNATVVAKVL
jgi:hypothetical protein